MASSESILLHVAELPPSSVAVLYQVRTLCPRPHPVFAANCAIFARRKSGQQPRRTAHPTSALLPLVAAFPGVARGSNSRISLRVHGACGGWWRRFNGGEGRGAGE